MFLYFLSVFSPLFHEFPFFSPCAFFLRCGRNKENSLQSFKDEKTLSLRAQQGHVAIDQEIKLFPMNYGKKGTKMGRENTKKQAKELCAIILVSPKLIKQNLFANGKNGERRQEKRKGNSN